MNRVKGLSFSKKDLELIHLYETHFFNKDIIESILTLLLHDQTLEDFKSYTFVNSLFKKRDAIFLETGQLPSGNSFLELKGVDRKFLKCLSKKIVQVARHYLVENGIIDESLSLELKEHPNFISIGEDITVNNADSRLKGSNPDALFPSPIEEINLEIIFQFLKSYNAVYTTGVSYGIAITKQVCQFFMTNKELYKLWNDPRVWNKLIVKTFYRYLGSNSFLKKEDNLNSARAIVLDYMFIDPYEEWSVSVELAYKKSYLGIFEMLCLNPRPIKDTYYYCAHSWGKYRICKHTALIRWHETSENIMLSNNGISQNWWRVNFGGIIHLDYASLLVKCKRFDIYGVWDSHDFMELCTIDDEVLDLTHSLIHKDPNRYPQWWTLGNSFGATLDIARIDRGFECWKKTMEHIRLNWANCFTGYNYIARYIFPPNTIYGSPSSINEWNFKKKSLETAKFNLEEHLDSAITYISGKEQFRKINIEELRDMNGINIINYENLTEINLNQLLRLITVNEELIHDILRYNNSHTVIHTALDYAIKHDIKIFISTRRIFDIAKDEDMLIKIIRINRNLDDPLIVSVDCSTNLVKLWMAWGGKVNIWNLNGLNPEMEDYIFDLLLENINNPSILLVMPGSVETFATNKRLYRLKDFAISNKNSAVINFCFRACNKLGIDVNEFFTESDLENSIANNHHETIDALLSNVKLDILLRDSNYYHRTTRYWTSEIFSGIIKYAASTAVDKVYDKVGGGSVAIRTIILDKEEKESMIKTAKVLDKYKLLHKPSLYELCIDRQHDGLYQAFVDAGILQRGELPYLEL